MNEGDENREWNPLGKHGYQEAFKLQAKLMDHYNPEKQVC